jgi:hypothetical protein
MSWQILTPSSKKKITADWHAAFPAFGVHKPMHLLRRTGPLLTGVLLERGAGNDSYKPIFHVHNLAHAFPVISLSMPREVPHEYVHVEWHASKFSGLAKRLGELAYLPVSGPLGLNDIIAGFRAYLQKPFSPYEPNTYRDLALICGWCGAQAELSNTLEEAKTAMSAWPAQVLRQIGGLKPWLDSVRACAQDQSGMRSTTASEITKHRLDGIPATELD